MRYTRKQLKEAIKARSNDIKFLLKLHPALQSELTTKTKMLAIALVILVIALGVLASISAGIGALAGLAISSASLSPLIAGGIIGATAQLVFILIGVYIQNKLLEIVQKSAIRDIQTSEEGKQLSGESEQILKEYYGSAEYKVKMCVNAIIFIGTCFGIGTGLAALGLTSPAAIGAVTVIVGVIICCPLSLLTDKVIECFFPEQPNSSVNSAIIGTDRTHILAN